MGFLFCCLVALVVVTLVLAPLAREPVSESPAADSSAIVRERKDRIYTAILELDFDYECGKVTADDYHRLRERYLGQAALFVEEEESTASAAERSEPTPDLSRRPAPAPCCASCGVALPDEARFCFLCGLAVPA